MSNAIATKQLEFSINEEWTQFARENPWASFISEFAKDSTGQEFMRGRGRSVAYKIKAENAKGEQTYECSQCGGEISGATVAHPIWDGPFPMSGSGKCHYETVPYCPKCEKQPDFHGNPIQVE